MKIEYIRNFIKLIEYKNFSALANDLSISQSTLSHQISQIEKALGGIQLINRTTKKFALTEAGKIFLLYARQLIEIYNSCERELRKFKSQESEPIVISASTIPGSHILPKLITDFKNAHPNVLFNVSINNSQLSIENVTKKKADFAGIGSFMDYEKEKFDYIEIGEDEFKFICSPTHELLKKGEKKITLKDIIPYPFIWREEGSGMRDIFQQQFKDYNELNIKLEMNDNDSIISTVNESNYISVMSEMMVNRSEKANLIKTFNIKEYPVIAKRKLYFIKLKELDLSGIKKSFWQYIKKKTEKIKK